MRASRSGVLGLVFLTAFLDLVGFSIIFPLFPQLLDHYVALEGPDSLIGRTVDSLRRFAADHENGEFFVVVLFGGILGSLYSVLQFLFAPVWGSLSDRVGRRPVLLLTLCGTALSYLVWFFAGSFELLLVARLLGGLMAGNVSIVTAAVADVTGPQERSKGMGIVGAAIGLGFIFGPAIGGYTAGTDLTEVWPTSARWGINPFSGPACVAFLLAAFNLVWAWRRFPETHPPEARGERTVERTANPARLFASVGAPGVQRVNWITFLYLTAFSAMEFTLVFLAVERFAYEPRHNAAMFVFVGLVIAFVQGGLVRRLAPRYGDKALAVAGLCFLIPAFVAVGLAQSQALLYAGLFLMALGSALAMPCLGGLASVYSPPSQQGLVLGTFRSAGALSRAVGPVVGGLLYWRLGSLAPYLGGAAFLALPALLAFGLPPVPIPARRAPPDAGTA